MFNKRIKKLSEEEFLQYFNDPMRLKGKDFEITGNKLKSYLSRVVKKENIKFDSEKIELSYVYEEADGKYEHLILSYGKEDVFLVIIINKEKILGYQILGYYILDLKEKYGIEE